MLGQLIANWVMLGVTSSCALAIWATTVFKLHGAVMPFAETLLYAGYAHLNTTQIYVEAIFVTASGAVMDLAMDVAASLQEVVDNHPSISSKRSIVLRSQSRTCSCWKLYFSPIPAAM